MRYCSNCGAPLPEDAIFCGNCGTPCAVRNDSAQTSTQPGGQAAGTGGSSWADALNEYVGNDRPADLNWRVLFSDVFKAHTTAEAEEIFICGTQRTTPPAHSVTASWPHPWLYSRVLIAMLAATVLLWVCVNVFENLNAVPGLVVVGSFAVPLATMIMFLEMNVWRNVSVYKVMSVFLVGGCASLVATMLLFEVFPSENEGFIGALTIGFVEETGKAVIVYYFLRRLGRLNILSGLLVGAAVGAGFAAFESAGYALQPVLQFMQYAGAYAVQGQALDPQIMFDGINQSIVLRGVLSPGGHVAWAAISGAALAITAKARGVIDTGALTDARFLRLFFIPVILHCLWDSPLSAWCHGIMPFSGYVALIVVVWIVVLILINMGLAEVSVAHGKS